MTDQSLEAYPEGTELAAAALSEYGPVKSPNRLSSQDGLMQTRREELLRQTGGKIPDFQRLEQHVFAESGALVNTNISPWNTSLDGTMRRAPAHAHDGTNTHFYLGRFDGRDYSKISVLRKMSRATQKGRHK